MSEPEETVTRGWSQPRTVTTAGSMPTSSNVSRKAAVGGVLAGLPATTGEAHLAPVGPQAGGAPGEQDPGLAVLLEEGDEHG